MNRLDEFVKATKGIIKKGKFKDYFVYIKRVSDPSCIMQMAVKDIICMPKKMFDIFTHKAAKWRVGAINEEQEIQSERPWGLR